MTPAEAIEHIKKVAFSVENEIEEIKASKFITALNTAIEALEKQMPKKPKTLNYGLLIEYGWKYECPNCGCAVGDNKNLAFAYGEYLEPYEDYCCSCGQALDWSDTK